MLNQRTVSLSCLLLCAGFILGLGILAAAVLFDSAGLGRCGLGLTMLACTYSVHRSLGLRCNQMQGAFDTGREYERGQGLSSIR